MKVCFFFFPFCEDARDPYVFRMYSFSQSIDSLVIPLIPVKVFALDVATSQTHLVQYVCEVLVCLHLPPPTMAPFVSAQWDAGGSATVPGAAAVPPPKPRELSPAAKRLLDRLSILQRITVTLVIDDVVFMGPADAPQVADGAAATVRALAEICDLYLIARVDSDDHEAHVAQLAQQAGIIASATADGTAGPAAAAAASRNDGDTKNEKNGIGSTFGSSGAAGSGGSGASSGSGSGVGVGGSGGGGGVVPHKLLFCSGGVGVMACVRQLRPRLHIDSSVPRLDELARHVPDLIRIAPDAQPAAPGAVPRWRELHTLSALLAEG
ncbi:unnamed protein product [Phaeothamnion confervicola]